VYIKSNSILQDNSYNAKVSMSSMRPGRFLASLENPNAHLLYSLIEKHELNKLMDLLEKERGNCQVVHVSNERKYSLLTYCALKNEFLAMKMIYEHAMQNRDSVDLSWV
jgi:hypothetical protein